MRRALIGLVATTLGLFVVLHLPPVQWWLVSTALSGLQTRQSLDLTWRDVSFNLDHALRAIQGCGSARVAPRRRWFRRTGRGEVSLRSLPRETRRPRRHAGQRQSSHSAREKGQWSTIPAAWTRSTPGSPPRSLPAFAALRLQNIAVIYDDRDARFRTETKGLRVDLLPTGTAPGDLAGELVAGATTIVRWEPRGTTLTLRCGPRVFLAWRRRRETVAAGRTRRAASSRTCALRSRAPIASRLTARADLKADQLAGWVEALDTARGDLQVDISMPAAGGAPAFADITFVRATLRSGEGWSSTTFAGRARSRPARSP